MAAAMTAAVFCDGVWWSAATAFGCHTTPAWCVAVRMFCGSEKSACTTPLRRYPVCWLCVATATRHRDKAGLLSGWRLATPRDPVLHLLILSSD